MEKAIKLFSGVRKWGGEWTRKKVLEVLIKIPSASPVSSNPENFAIGRRVMKNTGRLKI